MKEDGFLLIKIDFHNEIPIYLQLRNQIIQGIASGGLKTGEALPSVRQLASDIGINLHTVNKAYNILKQDGFLTVHRKSGVVVNISPGLKVNEEYKSRLQNELLPVISEACCRGMEPDEFNRVVNDIFEKIRLGGQDNG